ncbi:hypothetical protein EBB07_04135 [Paenibacillaceae bacterium]|nr:hypothetical protein EBB07_04135 [Paenibacillaceae bacterium]
MKGRGAMFKCFVEYRIASEHCSAYTQWMKARLVDNPHVHLYEGTEQPGLYVEVWEAATEGAAEQMKKERCDERSAWHEMTCWVPGGPSKVHAWIFRAV